MPFTQQSLKSYPIPEVEHTVTPRDCILYSLAVGMGANPTDPGQLEATGVDWKHVLHGEQYFELHRPLPIAATLLGRTRVIGINDRGADRGAFVYSRRDVVDKSTGEAVCSIEQTTVCRRDGGCGGSDPAPRKPHRLPEREADIVCDIAVSGQAALLYRMNGDHNPLHVDPKVAQQAGYPQPILHGLCTLGHAGHAILRHACDYDPARFKSMAVRFTAPVFPGETLRTLIWHEEDGVSFCSSVTERDTTVLGNGWVTLNPGAT
jgi:acyl dehydratase